MCRYFGNDFILEKLFQKVVERKIKDLTFNKLYDILYYVSIQLNREEETLLLVTRDGILSFAEIYSDFIDVDEDSDTIKIKKKDEVSLFPTVFDKDDNIDRIILDAINQVCAA